MRALSASELLTVWEQGIDAPLPRRALLLLAAACPEASGDALARMGIGRRDELLTELRERLFGPAITLLAPCPRCGETLETELRLSDVDPGSSPTEDIIRTLNADGYAISFRRLTAGDLLELPQDPDAARLALVSRCVIDAHAPDGTGCGPQTLPENAISMLAAALAQADPRADLQFALTCPGCGHEWGAPFDVNQALWKEIHAWAQRTMREVHTLARAYGWRELDVLALSPTRRQIYLELNQQ